MPNFNSQDNTFFDDFINELTTANLQSQGDMSIIEFANRIIFNNDPDFSLFPTQKAILKAFYREPLLEEELNILNTWVEEERSTWVEDRKYISLVLEAGRRASKLLCIETEIFTKEGFKKLKNIHINDYVYNAKGELTKVINETKIIKNKVCYKITFSNNENVICSDDHLWRTKNITEDFFTVKTTEQLFKNKSNDLIDEYLVKTLNQENILISTNSQKRYVKKIQPIASVPVKCLEVEDNSHVFLITKSFIPTHNCNSESGIILSTKGDITYGELHKLLQAGEKVGIYTHNFNNTIVESYITYDLKTELNAIEQTYKVTTKQGKQEICNENHPFLTWDSDSIYPYWKQLKDLKEKDFIATSSEVPLFGTETLSKDDLRVYAIKLTTPLDKYHKYKKYLISYFNTTHFFPILKNIEIPIETICKLNKEHLQLFLTYILTYSQDLRETVRVTKAHHIAKKERRFRLNVSLTNYQDIIARQFLKFGINFKVNKLRISLFNSSTKFKLVSTFGSEFLYQKHLRKKAVRPNTNNELDSEEYLPIKVLPQYILPNEDPNRRPQIRKRILAAKAEKLNDEKLYDWATNHINWEQIISIEPYKVEQTIALEVADTNVIGNPIISHNSTMASIIALKEFYDLIVLDNPHKRYNILSGSPIAILVMAQSQAQVKETIFAAIKGYANNSRYFASLQNKGIIEILSEEIRCAEKNVSIYAKHTNSKSLVGYTLKCMLLDEVARFESIGEEGKNKAFEIWENVAAGGSTFGHDFKKVAISSAWEPNDPIEILYKRANKDPLTLAFKLTTFQINLNIRKETPVIVTDYTNDFIKARREYEGIRFTKFNTFIDIENLNKAATAVSIIDAVPSEIDSKTLAGTAYYAGVEITRIAKNKPEDSLSFIHIDPALKKDSAALAIARGVLIENKWKIQIDALLKWEPHTDNKGIKRIVSFIDIENKIDEICRVRRVGKVTLDQWNSASILQKLQSQGIDAQIASCSRESQFTYFTLFRDLLAHDYIILPKDSLWSNNAITELSELVLKANRQVIHPTAGKDLADAIVNAVYQCHQHMLRTGLSLNMGVSTNIVSSQSLAPLQRVNIINPSTTKEQLKIGSAIDKLYKVRNKLK